MIDTTIEIWFEEDYEDIKDDPNMIFEKYYNAISKLIKKLAFEKSFDRDELIQQSYILFREFCKRYDPYYNGNFISFDKYLFSNLYTYLRSHIQRYYFKTKRETTADFDFSTIADKTNNTIDVDLDCKNFIDKLPHDTAQVVEMLMDGQTQQQIAEKLNVSQVRIYQIVKYLREVITEKITVNKATHPKQKKIIEACKEVRFLKDICKTKTVRKKRNTEENYKELLQQAKEQKVMICELILTKEQITDIITRRSKGEVISKIARCYSLSEPTITKLYNKYKEKEGR